MKSEGEIVFYATTWCPDCRRSQRLLDRHGIAYRWVDIDQDGPARVFVEEINWGFRSVPTIVFPDGAILVEPSDRELTRKLCPE